MALMKGSMLLLSLVTPAFLSLTSSNAVAQEFMSQEELLATFPGSTIRAKSNNGKSWFQIYSTGGKKGTIEGEFDGAPIKSKWYVKGDQWCEDWGDGKACWDVERVDEKSLRIYENGTPRKNLWKID
jgi:hypothetical protein